MPHTWSVGLPSAQATVLVLYSRVFENLAKSLRGRYFRAPTPNGIAETTDASSDSLVRLGFRRTQYDFQ